MAIALGKACILKSGKFVSASDIQESYTEGLYPCYGGNGIRGYVSEYSHDGCYPLIGRQGALCGNVNYTYGKFRATEHAVVVQPVEEIDSRWLYYKLISMDLGQYATGAAQPGLAVSKLEQLPIDVPSILEQQNITKIFDLLENLLALRKQQLNKLDKLVKARFVELFIGKGYPTRTVNEVSLGKGEYGAQSASVEYDPSRPRYVRITDINDDGTLNDDVVASINTADDEEYRLEYGDFMFARMGATVGKTYVFIEGNQIFAGYLIRYKLNQSLINPRYLFWYTKLDEYWNWVKLNQSGAAQPGINAKKYGSLRIPVPPIEEQNAFATFVAQTDKSKLPIQQSLDKLELLKKALMQKYFR